VTRIPEILELVYPVVGQAGLDVGAIGVGENAADGLIVGFSVGAVEGGVGAVRENGAGGLNGHRGHLQAELVGLEWEGRGTLASGYGRVRRGITRGCGDGGMAYVGQGGRCRGRRYVQYVYRAMMRK